MITAVRVPTSAAIDFVGGGIDPLGINRSISEYITELLLDTPPRLSFPWEWGPNSDGRNGRGVDDPLTVYISLPFGTYQEETPEWSVSVKDILLEDILDCHTDRDGRVRDGASIAMIEGLIRSLREVANKMELAIDRT